MSPETLFYSMYGFFDALSDAMFALMGMAIVPAALLTVALGGAALAPRRPELPAPHSVDELEAARREYEAKPDPLTERFKALEAADKE